MVFILEALEEFRAVGHVAFVGAFGDFFALVKSVEGKLNAFSVSFEDFDLDPDDQADGGRRDVGEVDMGAEADLPLLEGGCDTCHRGLFDQLQEHRRREDIDSFIARLFGGHPLFNAALAFVRPAGFEFLAHCQTRYAEQPHESFRGPVR